MADGLPEGFPSGYALDLAERAKACDLLLKTAARVLHTGTAGRPSPPRPSPTSTARTRAGRLKAATSLLSKPPQQPASNAGPRLRTRRVKNFTPKKRPVTRRQTAAAAILAPPAVLQNRSPSRETSEMQDSSSKEGGHTEKTGGELSPSPQESDAASGGSSTDTTSSPTSSSSWSHNTPASSPNTSVEESSPEHKEQLSASPLETDDTGTPGKAALSTQQAEGEKQVSLTLPTTPLSRASTQPSRDVNCSQETQPRPLARNSCVLGPPEEQFPSLPSTGAPSGTKLCEPQVPITNPWQKNQRIQKPAVSTQKSSTPPSQLPASLGSTSQLETVLYRPTGRKNTFRSATQEAISAQLAAVEGAHRVRINFGRNVVAVDVAAGAPLASLLAVSNICEIPVRARQASTNTCSGVIHNVDPALTEEDLRDNIASQLPVLQCTRSGRNVVVMFSGRKPPQDIELYKQRRPVRARRPRPVQCERCGRYGHTDITCTAHERCVRCGGPHPRADCTAQRPRCIFCGAAHLATEPRCPRWQQERQLLEVRAQSARPMTRREAFAVVRKNDPTAKNSATREGFSYAAAAGGSTASSTSPTTAPENASAISVLVAAVRAALDFLPRDCPVRPLCIAALATQQAMTHHGE